MKKNTGITENVLDLIGNTPLVRLNKVTANIKGNFYGKLESFNPGDSVKDRIANYIVERAEKEGRFFPQDPATKAEVTQWVMWQMANQGPKLGECGHFRRLGDREGDQSYAVRRFTDEANRLYGVMNNCLYDRRYLVGDEYTIADMICYPWCAGIANQGQDIDEFVYFKRWYEALSERPAVKRGMAVGADLSVDASTLSEAESQRRAKIMYNQRARPAPDGGLLA